MAKQIKFQSTLPRRERHARTPLLTSLEKNFNPRSREGSDDQRPRPLRPHRHFNPRSREGSDERVKPYVDIKRLFQSTLPRRERLRELLDIFPQRVISIHAPAKGATATTWSGWWISTNFNPRSREGSDSIY